MLPEVTKDKLCLKCGGTTTHKLVPSEHGTNWSCTGCGNSLLAYTHAQMQDTVTKTMFGITGCSTVPSIPNTLRVFLEHRAPGATEKEASWESITQHVELTGELPEKGKPMFAKTGSGVAVPYGKVLRVES